MNKKPFHKNINDELLILGDLIVEKSHESESGIYWNSNSHNKSEIYKGHSVLNYNIYNGICGILLFLFELYKYTGNQKYATTSIKGVNWLHNTVNANNKNRLGLYTGQSGLIYTYIKAKEVNNDDKYLEYALELAKINRKYVNVHSDDLLSGSAGILLCLLQLHSETSEKILIDSIIYYTNIIINNALNGPKGLCWGKGPHRIKSLCGMAHGSSGIGFVFLELYNYLDNVCFLKLAQEAFEYEDHWLKQYGYWPDFRKESATLKSYNSNLIAFLNNDLANFTKGTNRDTWCHGSFGIGLARLRAYEIIGEEKYLTMVESIINNQSNVIDKKGNNADYTLCHGLFGKAVFYLEAAKILKNQHLEDKAWNIVLACISSNYLHNCNLSLLNGISGIGMLLVMLLNKTSSANILLPRLKLQNKYKGNNELNNYYSTNFIRERLLSRTHKNTIYALKGLSPSLYDKYISTPLLNTVKHEYNTFHKFSKKIILQHKELLKIYEFESYIHNLEHNIISYSFIYFCWEYIYYRVPSLLNDLFDVTLILNPSVKNVCIDNAIIKMSSTYLSPYELIVNKSMGIIFVEININLFHIYSLLSKPRTLKEILESFKSQYGNLSVHRKMAIDNYVINNIKEAVKNGFIINNKDMDLLDYGRID